MNNREKLMQNTKWMIGLVRPPKTLKAGEVFFVPAGVVHDGRNAGSGKAVVLATYIVETGKPVASPAK